MVIIAQESTTELIILWN